MFSTLTSVFFWNIYVLKLARLKLSVNSFLIMIMTTTHQKIHRTPFLKQIYLYLTLTFICSILQWKNILIISTIQSQSMYVYLMKGKEKVSGWISISGVPSSTLLAYKSYVRYHQFLSVLSAKLKQSGLELSLIKIFIKACKNCSRLLAQVYRTKLENLPLDQVGIGVHLRKVI